MRTTINVEDRLLAEVKVVAARSSRSVSSVVEDALRDFLARHEGNVRRAPVDLPVFGKAGEVPLIDILDRDALAATLGDDAA